MDLKLAAQLYDYLIRQGYAPQLQGSPGENGADHVLSVGVADLNTLRALADRIEEYGLAFVAQVHVGSAQQEPSSE